VEVGTASDKGFARGWDGSGEKESVFMDEEARTSGTSELFILPTGAWDSASAF